MECACDRDGSAEGNAMAAGAAGDGSGKALARRVVARGRMAATNAGMSALGSRVFSDRIVVGYRIVVGRRVLVRGRVIARDRLGWNLVFIQCWHCLLRFGYTLIVLRHPAPSLMHLMRGRARATSGRSAQRAMACLGGTDRTERLAAVQVTGAVRQPGKRPGVRTRIQRASHARRRRVSPSTFHDWMLSASAMPAGVVARDSAGIAMQYPPPMVTAPLEGDLFLA